MRTSRISIEKPHTETDPSTTSFSKNNKGKEKASQQFEPDHLKDLAATQTFTGNTSSVLNPTKIGSGVDLLSTLDKGSSQTPTESTMVLFDKSSQVSTKSAIVLFDGSSQSSTKTIAIPLDDDDRVSYYSIYKALFLTLLISYQFILFLDFNTI